MTPVRVTVVRLSDYAIVIDRIVDHDNQRHRQWMGKTAYWAARSGHAMMSTPSRDGCFGWIVRPIQNHEIDKTADNLDISAIRRQALKEAAQAIECLPYRIEPLGGQKTSYIQLGEAAAAIRALAAEDGPGNREIARLREALAPFAKAGELFAGIPPGPFEQSIYRPAAGDEWAIGENDLRRAAATMKETVR